MAGPGIAIAGLNDAVRARAWPARRVPQHGQDRRAPGALDGVDGAHLTVATGLALDEVPA